jgi:hypothetical protein
MTAMKYALLSAVATVAFFFALPGMAQTTIITFDNGAEGWNGNGLIEQSGGNPDANVHFLVESSDIEYRTASNPAFIGDLTQNDSITVGIDVLVNSITLEGIEISRDQIVEFRSHALAQGGYPYSAVWYNLGVLQAETEWGSFSVSFTPASQELPNGWGGYGADDPVTGAPMLPAGVTFADVMASVDELAFTTAEPGYFNAFDLFDVRIDNLSIERGDDMVFANGFELQ